MKIKAAVTRAPHAPMSLETLEIEAPRANEVLIRISAVRRLPHRHRHSIKSVSLPNWNT